MASDTETVSIRLPSGMLEKIDGYIQTSGHFTTRPAYIVNAMEGLFRTLVDSRIKVDAQIDEISKIASIEPNVILNITKTVMDRYMDKYAQFEGEPVQVLLRVPAVRLKDIDDYQTVLGFYYKRADFIRMAVSNQIALDESFEEKLERVKYHKVQQKRSSDEIIQSVLRNMSNDSEGVNGMMSILETVIRESNKPKRVTQQYTTASGKNRYGA